MELQFPKKTLTYLHLVKREIQSQEQTQELRIPEDKPDVGKILGSWGQVLLRAKEWRDGEVVVSGGVMAWILYQPEGENAAVQSVEAWIPFQIKCEIPITQHDGSIRTIPLLRSVDARTTSARKMIARVTVAVVLEAFTQSDLTVCQPPELPEDVNLLVRKYPVMIPRECGEKTFEMDEELTLPASCENPKQIVRFSFQPETLDQKVLSGKVAFRGVGILHLLYLSETGNLCTWDFEVPFSRYAELDDVYEQEAQPIVIPVVTGLDLELNEDKFQLKAALTGQYMIFDRSEIELVQDAYSNLRQVETMNQMLELPVMLDRKLSSVSAEVSLDHNDMRIIDIAFYPDQPQLQRNGETTRYALSGQFHVLMCDEHQQLHGVVQRWNENCELQTSSNVISYCVLLPSGLPRQTSVSGTVCVSGDMLLDTVCVIEEGMPMLCALELGTERLPDGNRPNLIVRKMRDDSIWDIAKACGSTVEAIWAVNHLESEPDPDRILLIPVQ